MEAALLGIVQNINKYLSDYILIALLIGIGLFYSIKTRFVQVRCLGEGFKNMFSKQKKDGNVNSFQALATAIAAQVGTGNIVGACGAILLGGPGAIFWMWVIAFFGMATIYAEAVLAQKTRITNENGEFIGGPVYYIRTAFKGAFGKFLAGFFAVAAVLALGFMGAMVQSNSISENIISALTGKDVAGKEIINFGFWQVAATDDAKKMIALVIGIIVAVLAGVIFLGGVKRLASVTEKVVPVMAILYLLGGIVVLAFKIKVIPATFGLIFKYAFTPTAILGGSVGAAFKAAISQGAKRGLFSNEAGMGSTPHAHALADVETPHQQGTMAMVGVFIDTFVVLTMTALVVISTFYTKGGELALQGAAEDSSIIKTNMAQLAFSQVMGAGFGGKFIAICLFFFAFSTILGWTFFGRVNVEYLFGKKSNIPYSIIALVFIVMGACLSNDLVWELTDMFNQLMVIPNVLALVVLAKLVTEQSNKKKEKLKK